MLDQMLPAALFSLALVFARIGAMVMVLPVFGEQYVQVRLRLVLAILLTLIIAPRAGALPVLPAEPARLIPLIGGEILLGLAIAGIARLTVTALHVAGTLVAVQSGLAAAQNLDPTQGTQSAVSSNFIVMLGTTVIVLTDLHHLLISALVESYRLFPVQGVVPVGDLARLATGVVADTFKLGVQMAAPFLAFGIVFNVLLGLMNRLMPVMQVFFIAMPLQLPLAFLLFALSVGMMIAVFLDHFVAALGPLIP
ncbi:flagellar biosynthetic protein FliR [Zavarzinia compransoris]|uniref:Flagellar biosynthetic protein FliR n=1 Tax=Zavarzinia compransoris TaxID=1264899 RepID=A0A317E352_9PROT|nr:flagellar biosynthetic protein FliR [Zavarzinia compransoris]PWR19813.1 flagellar type III secretion system protein FliR [Zavarzinia compransoris]TDP45082.1 flagellar biosynthetic protein FliR [Zavarzinia compransoris]